MTKIEIEKYRVDYGRAIEYSRPFYIELPPLLSPAAAAQENHGVCQMMYKLGMMWISWQCTNFIKEGLSFYKMAYLEDWPSLTNPNIQGLDALKSLSYNSTNNFSSFEIGQIKHAVLTNEQAKPAGKGIPHGISDDEYRYMAEGCSGWNSWLSKAHGMQQRRMKLLISLFFMRMARSHLPLWKRLHARICMISVF